MSPQGRLALLLGKTASKGALRWRVYSTSALRPGPRRTATLENHVLLRVMVRIRVVLKVVDGREDDLVIRSFAAIERNQFPFQNPKQLFNVAMVPDEELRRCMSSRTAPARPSSRLYRYRYEALHDLALDQTEAARFAILTVVKRVADCG